MKARKDKIISFKDVNKMYGNKTVLKNITFDLYEHQFVALIGNNGCGKTTLINLLCNLTSLDSGKIEIQGKELNDKSYRFKRNLGIVLSDPYYVEEFDVVEYLKFVCYFQEIPSNIISRRIDELISYFELHKYKRDKIRTLSKGNKMKLTLCGALIHNPQILVFDEPFSNLDIETTDKLISLIKSLQTKKSLFITSHNLDLVIKICDRFLILHDQGVKLDICKSQYKNESELKIAIKNYLKISPFSNEFSWLD